MLSLKWRPLRMAVHLSRTEPNSASLEAAVVQNWSGKTDMSIWAPYSLSQAPAEIKSPTALRRSAPLIEVVSSQVGSGFGNDQVVNAKGCGVRAFIVGLHLGSGNKLRAERFCWNPVKRRADMQKCRADFGTGET